MDINRFRSLLLDHSRGKASGEELAELSDYLQQQQGRATDLYLLIEEAWLASNEESDPVFQPEEGAAMLAKILDRDQVDQAQLPAAPHRIPFLRKWYWAAASIILALAIGTIFWPGNKKDTSSVITAADIQPGKDGAILTLADETQVVLDSLGNGVVAMQNGTQVVLKNGQLTYGLTGNAAGGITYNTMSTPKGRQFSLVLADGTRVWLNAASSLRYPTVFSGAERQVTVTGEAYFEVAQDAERPFYVSVNGKAAVKVLGTDFNVNAYEDEHSLNTTLLKGSISITRISPGSLLPDQPAILQPGQQARMAASGADENKEVKVVEADISKVMAWKNGLFNFEDLSLEEAMRQVARWYDVEIVYEGVVPKTRFWGKLSRNKPLDAVIRAVQDADVHCTLEGRRLIIKASDAK